MVVLGGGPGGYAAALRAAVRGLDVALVEAADLGGTCLHRGCIPSQALLHVAEVVHGAGRGDLGLRIAYRGLDLERVRTHRDRVVSGLHRGLEGLVGRRGITYHAGWGTIREPGVVEVTGADGAVQRVRGRHVVVATGSRPRHLAQADVDGDVVLLSDHALRVDRVPRSAVIVGAGAIGMEFATLWRTLGAEVTVLEAMDRVVPLEDEDVSALVAGAFARWGIDAVAPAHVTEVTVDRSTDPRVRVAFDAPDGARTVEVDTVLVAIGRDPATDGTGLEELGLRDERGFVPVDAYGRTTVDGVWAAGDVVNTLARAHMAFAEGAVVADAIAGTDPEPVDHELLPRATYCRPEVASVGLTEAAARARFDDVGSTVQPLRDTAKGVISGLDGAVKVVARRGGTILGVHIVGPRAADLVGEAALLTAWGAGVEDAASIVHAHPTLSETLGETFLTAAGAPFHGRSEVHPYGGRSRSPVE